MSVYNLSSAERNIMRDLIELGSLVAVANKRCRSVRTLEGQTRNARRKCGNVSLIALAVLVDRADREPRTLINDRMEMLA
jgi:hypothetical protein